MKAVLVLLSLPINVIVRGFVLRQLWAWFIMRQFSVSPLSIPMALGMSVTIGYLTMHAPKKGEESQDFVWLFIYDFLGAAMALSFGWIYSLFL